MARVVKGSHSFTYTYRVYPLTELHIPAFAFRATKILPLSRSIPLISNTNPVGFFDALLNTMGLLLIPNGFSVGNF